MSEPNPYADGEYKWGPGQGAGTPGYGYPQDATPGYGYPQDATPGPGPYQAPAYQPTLPGGVALPPQYATGGAPSFAIGDISVVGDQILTPAGPMPLRGAVWNAMDLSRTEEKISTAGIVLACLFVAACGLGLLFLLMKEQTTTGFVQITVNSGGKHHSTMIPAVRPDTIHWAMAQINYARSLSV
ncbi:hypothetical protein ABZ572_25005 [Streptomyces sp. NPDC018338]|uniref:hypothetical protein n=1 Tax=Streptomyces sp. NPDC018338 TaxID=3157192 RepID=UPI0033CCFA9E